MILKHGNIWEALALSDLLCITTNSTLMSNGELVMGAGIALQAKQRFPELPRQLGEIIRKTRPFYGLVYLPIEGGRYLGAFQTKTHWRSPSTTDLIRRSTKMLAELAEANPYWRIDLNFPGIGRGGLPRSVVLPIIQALPDNVHVWEC